GPKAVAAEAIIAPSVTVQGTDRSIWPSRITSIIPVAMTPRTAPTLSCCSRYSGDRKLGEYRLPISSSRMMQPKAVATGRSMRLVQLVWRAGVVSSLSVVIGTSGEQVEPVAHLEQAGGPQRHGQQQHHALE